MLGDKDIEVNDRAASNSAEKSPEDIETIHTIKRSNLRTRLRVYS